MMGVLSGVMGRSPVQNVALLTSPPGKSSVTTFSSVALRCGLRLKSKPLSSAMPPTRILLLKRVTATL